MSDRREDLKDLVWDNPYLSEGEKKFAADAIARGERIQREVDRIQGLASGFREDAERGDAEAQYNLGNSYDFGMGVEQDHAQAAAWYRKAAEQGHAKAQFNLGVCYDHGEGVEQDLAQAAKWYAKAAEQGCAEAQYNLGFCYAHGEGVERDYAQAVKWYTKAAEQGDAEAQNNLGVCYEKGEGVKRDYAQAVEWYAKSADQGDAQAQYNIGGLYYNGEGVTRNYDTAAEWFSKAADQGHAGARTTIEKMCEDGDLWKHVEKAAEAGSATAQICLGESYFLGKGPAHDCAKAASLWRKAAEAGNAEAQFYLGYRCCYFGQGTAQDFAQAARWLEKAADQGHAQAQYKLAECYEYGVGVRQDLDKAQKLYESAASDVKEAKEKLERGNLGAYEPPKYSDYDMRHFGSEANDEFAVAVIYANDLCDKKMGPYWAAAYVYRSFGRITDSQFPPQLVKRTMEIVKAERERQAFREAHKPEIEALIDRIKNPRLKEAYPKEYAEYRRLKSLHKGTKEGVAKCRTAFLLMLVVVGLAVVNLLFGESIKAAAFMVFFHGLGQIPLTLAYIGFFGGSALCIGETSRGVMLAGIIAGIVFGIWYYTNRLPVVPLVAACVFAAMVIMVAVYEKKSLGNVKKFDDYNKEVIEPLAEKLRAQYRKEYEERFGEKPGV